MMIVIPPIRAMTLKPRALLVMRKAWKKTG